MTTTHLVHVPLRMDEFHRWAAERSLADLERFDAGNALHILLSGMFGKGIVQPFRLLRARRNPVGTLYGYSPDPAEKLQRTAAEAATPDAIGILEPGRLRTKAMPEAWEAGTRVGYDTHVRPIERIAKTERRKGEHTRYAEIDAIDKPPVDSREHRETKPERAYAAWLARRVGDAADIESCRLTRFSREGGRRGRQRMPRGPSAVLQGTLRIRSGEAFRRLVQAGIGRHKAYGYGTGRAALKPGARPDHPGKGQNEPDAGRDPAMDPRRVRTPGRGRHPGDGPGRSRSTRPLQRRVRASRTADEIPARHEPGTGPHSRTVRGIICGGCCGWPTRRRARKSTTRCVQKDTPAAGDGADKRSEHRGADERSRNGHSRGASWRELSRKRGGCRQTGQGS